MRIFTANLDGVFQYMVAAKTKKRALDLLGCTAYTFANCGSENDGARDEDMQIALANPETVFKRRHSASGPPVWSRMARQSRHPIRCTRRVARS